MRQNPVIMKRRNADKEKGNSILPKYGMIVLLIAAAYILSGCKTICNTFCEPIIKERIVVQYVNVAVAAECPKPNVPARKRLPSTEVLDGPFKDIRGCLMNQEYLLFRVNELESTLDVYQNSTVKDKK